MSNQSTYLSYIFTNSSDNVASLDDQKFILTELQIYSPSVHQYNSTRQIAELLMIHTSSDNSSHELIISIPISQTGTGVSDIGFNNLLSISKTEIPTASAGVKNELIPSLNLNNFIGQTGYYTYEGNHINNCYQQAYYIVYYPSNFSIFINNDYLTNNVISILQDSNIGVQDNNNYFLNQNGPNFSLGDVTYMDCVAVNTSEDTIEAPTYSSTFADSSSGKAILYVIIIFIVLILVFLLLYVIVIQINKYVTSRNPTFN
jgi:carbonic anhydrase